ncbi:MAG: DEAD/DEAH box helicase [Candidatus Obscuribacterales bacterium]|nr:DEAD/DEAH box helicase [Steroidobacteraceae bacterium]
MPFSTLGLATPLLRAIDEKNYLVPTPIQLAAIPAILRGGDVRACAQTGSGKTAAFALPILQKLFDNRGESARYVEVLVLVPTRELAMQIGESFRAYARYLPKQLRIVTMFGGVSINPQMMALRGGADIVVATPGRLIDLVEHNALRLDAVSTLVLDEADKLFDLGFADELAHILQMLSTRRQTLLFSATFPPAVQTLADAILREPTVIDIEPTPAAEPSIMQRAIAVDAARRTQLLRHLIQENSWSRVLVFVATKYSTEHVAEKLRRAGINAAPFHGELSQGARTQTLADFKASKLQVVIATDVAARGIDISQLPVVVNYDLPRSAVDYVHRIGRTGRAGESGVAVSFICAETEAHFRLIEKRNAVNLPREQIAGFEPTNSIPAESPAPNSAGGIKGKRKSKKDKLREAAAQTSVIATPGATQGAAKFDPWKRTKL